MVFHWIDHIFKLWKCKLADGVKLFEEFNSFIVALTDGFKTHYQMMLDSLIDSWDMFQMCLLV